MPRVSQRTERQFNVRLDDDERALLEIERERLGLRNTGDVIRVWIAAIAERRSGIDREVGAKQLARTKRAVTIRRIKRNTVSGKASKSDRMTQRERVTA
jgi:hypothetical protein